MSAVKCNESEPKCLKVGHLYLLKLYNLESIKHHNKMFHQAIFSDTCRMMLLLNFVPSECFCVGLSF